MTSNLYRTVLGSLLGLVAGHAAFAGPVEDGNAGMDALNKGDYDSAIRLFSRALRSGALSRDDREFAYVERGTAYLKKGDYRAATVDLQTALKLKPDDADATHQLELAQQGGGSSTTPSPRGGSVDADASATQGMNALNSGNFSRAVQLFTVAINAGTLGPQDTELAYLSRGKAYLQTGDSRRAALDFNRALHINPSDQDAQSGFGQGTASV